MHHGITFNFGCQNIFETCFSYHKDIRIGATDYYYVFLHNCAISIDSCSPIIKFYSFINFSLLMNAVILLVNCLVLILHLYTHFLSLRCYSLLKHYLELCITDNALKVSQSPYCFTTLDLMVLKTISPGCGVRASLMLFLMLQLNSSADSFWDHCDQK